MRGLLIGGVLLAAVSCNGNGDGMGPVAATGSLRVIQAAESTATLDVLVDGGVVINGLGTGTISSPVTVPVGQRVIGFRPAGGTTSPNLLQLAVLADSEYTAVVIDSSTVLNPIALTDSGGIPAAGKTKLQVANFVSLIGPIDVYRRQTRLRRVGRSHVPFRVPCREWLCPERSRRLAGTRSVRGPDRRSPTRRAPGYAAQRGAHLTGRRPGSHGCTPGQDGRGHRYRPYAEPLDRDLRTGRESPQVIRGPLGNNERVGRRLEH